MLSTSPSLNCSLDTSLPPIIGVSSMFAYGTPHLSWRSYAAWIADSPIWHWPPETTQIEGPGAP